jgi:hypothetical protein
MVSKNDSVFVPCNELNMCLSLNSLKYPVIVYTQEVLYKIVIKATFLSQEVYIYKIDIIILHLIILVQFI